MQQKYIPALIMLAAGAVVCIFDIYNKVNLLTSLKRLLLVMVIFYIIGLIAKAIVAKATSPKPKEEKEENEAINERETAGKEESTAPAEGKQQQ